MLISTIIPVYNAEKYLCRCLDSIISAQIDEVSNEILLIDDGSTDNSLTICKDYESRYSNIKVFSQPNQGPSVARNLGLDHAQGEWITFVDSDDWVVDNYYMIINESINNYPGIDIITFGYIKSSEIKNIKHFQYNNFNVIYEHNDILKILQNTNHSKFLLFPWNKVYSKNLKLKFPTDIRLGEDTLVNLEAFYKSNSVVFIEKYIYHYFENLDSVTSQKFKPTLIEDMERHFESKLSFYKSNPELNQKEYLEDLARVNLEKTFFSFLANFLANENYNLERSFKRIRKTELIQFGFKYYNFQKASGVKVKITLILFKLKLYKILKLIYKK